MHDSISFRQLVAALPRALALAGALVVFDAQAALAMKIHVDVKRTAAPGVKSLPPDSSGEFELFLAGSHIEVRDPGTATIYDFGKRRRIAIDRKSSRYTDYSLYDVAGFRVLELQNRERIGQALAAAKTDAKPTDKVDDEHLLSVMSRNGTAFDSRSEEGETILVVDGKPLMRVANQGTSANDGDVRQFVKFLRYTYGGHPVALQSIEKQQRIPAKLRYMSREVWGEATVSLKIDDVRKIEDAAYDLSKFSPRMAPAGGDGLEELLDNAWQAAAPFSDEEKRRATDDIARAFAERRPFDAMLAAIELSLSTGAALPPFSAEQIAALKADPAASRLSGILPAKTKEQWETAIKVLRELRPQAANRQHVLKIFEANDRAAQGDLPGAKKLFIEALQANPAIAGAWKDLGDVLVRSFDTARGWRCWDIGRRIAPQLGNFTSVNRFEERLASSHPEYF